MSTSQFERIRAEVAKKYINIVGVNNDILLVNYRLFISESNLDDDVILADIKRWKARVRQLNGCEAKIFVPRVEAQQQDIMALMQENTQYEHKFAELQKLLAEKEAEITHLSHQLTIATDHKWDGLDEMQKQKDSQIQELNQLIARYRTKVSETDKTIFELKETNSHLRQQNSTLNATLSEYRRVYKLLEENNTKLKAQVEDLVFKLNDQSFGEFNSIISGGGGFTEEDLAILN